MQFPTGVQGDSQHIFLKCKNSSGHDNLLSLSLCPKEIGREWRQGAGERKPQGPHQYNL